MKCIRLTLCLQIPSFLKVYKTTVDVGVHEVYQTIFTLEIPSFSKVCETTVDLVDHEVYQSDFTLKIASFSKVYETTADLVDHELYQSDFLSCKYRAFRKSMRPLYTFSTTKCISLTLHCKYQACSLTDHCMPCEP